MDDANYNKQKNSLQLFFVTFKSCLQDQAVLLHEEKDNEINMKNDEKKGLSFWAIYTFPMLQATSINLQGENLQVM